MKIETKIFFPIKPDGKRLLYYNIFHNPPLCVWVKKKYPPKMKPKKKTVTKMNVILSIPFYLFKKYFSYNNIRMFRLFKDIFKLNKNTTYQFKFVETVEVASAAVGSVSVVIIHVWWFLVSVGYFVFLYFTVFLT